MSNTVQSWAFWAISGNFYMLLHYSTLSKIDCGEGGPRFESRRRKFFCGNQSLADSENGWMDARVAEIQDRLCGSDREE